MSDRQLIADLLSALEYHTEQTRPIEFSRVAIEAAREYLRKPAQQQEPVAKIEITRSKHTGEVDGWAFVERPRNAPAGIYSVYTSPQPAIPTVITCPFCSSEHVPGWLHDYNMDRGAYGEQPAQQHIEHCLWARNGNTPCPHVQPAIKQDLTPEQPAQQEPVAFPTVRFEKVAEGIEVGYDTLGGVDIRLGGEFVYVHINYDYRYTDNATRKALADQIVGLLTSPPANNQCKFPMCHSEEYQQVLAEQIKQELYTGETAQQQEPVKACVTGQCPCKSECDSAQCCLYTSPPAQRKPLTDEEIEKVWRRVQANDFHDCVQPFARAIEAAHCITKGTK